MKTINRNNLAFSNFTLINIKYGANHQITQWICSTHTRLRKVFTFITINLCGFLGESKFAIQRANLQLFPDKHKEEVWRQKSLSFSLLIASTYNSFYAKFLFKNMRVIRRVSNKSIFDFSKNVYLLSGSNK